MTKRRNAFTLVELLVVIGIIALLIGILLPTLNNARESANRTKCLSNVRQIAMAIVMYCNDNKGVFPVLPRGADETSSSTSPSEAIHWEMDNAAGNQGWNLTPSSPGAKFDPSIARMGIGPYLNVSPTNVNMLRCPTDPNWQTRLSVYGTAYSFSYSINWSFSGDSLDLSANPHIDPNAPAPRNKINQVLDTSNKVLVIEEDERTIDDAVCSVSENPVFWGWNNRLALRHDTVYRKKPEAAPPPASSPNAWIPNANGKGNVGFVDGHAAYLPRSYVHARAHCIGNAADITGPDIPMHMDGP